MNKTRSTTTLTLNNLALSLKRSIDLHPHNHQMAKSVSTCNMVNQRTNHQRYGLRVDRTQRTDGSSHNRNDTEGAKLKAELIYQDTDDTVGEQYYLHCEHNSKTKQQQLLQTRATSLMKQITELQTRISTNYQQKMTANQPPAQQTNYTKMHRLSNYKSQIDAYESITQQEAQCEQEYGRLCSNLCELECRAGMLKQQNDSYYANLQMNLAQKEHYEQIMNLYTSQFTGESQILLRILVKEKDQLQTSAQISKGNQAISATETQFAEWLQDSGYSLQEKIFTHKINSYRIELTGMEEQLNKYVESKNQEYRGWYGDGNAETGGRGMAKLREILCLVLKQYVRSYNRDICKAEDVLSLEQIFKDGVELFLCRRSDLLEQYTKALRGYQYTYIGRHNAETGNHHQITPKIKQKYPKSIIQQYLSTLSKIHKLIDSSAKLFLCRQINQDFVDKLRNIKLSRIQLEQQVEAMREHLVGFQAQMEQQLANQSVAIMEETRDQCDGRYSLDVLKPKLKGMRKQQEERLRQMRVAYWKIKQLDRSTLPTGNTHHSIQLMNQYQSLQQQIKDMQLQIKAVSKQLAQIRQDKTFIENQMNYVLGKWQQADTMKKELKALHKQFNKTNRQLRDIKLHSFRDRTTHAKRKGSGGHILVDNTFKLNSSKTLKLNGNDKQSRAGQRYLLIGQTDHPTDSVIKSIGKNHCFPSQTNGLVSMNSTSCLRNRQRQESNIGNRLSTTSKKLPKSVLEQFENQIGQILTRKTSLLSRASFKPVLREKKCSNQLTKMLISKLTKC